MLPFQSAVGSAENDNLCLVRYRLCRTRFWDDLKEEMSLKNELCLSENFFKENTGLFAKEVSQVETGYHLCMKTVNVYIDSWDSDEHLFEYVMIYCLGKLELKVSD